MASRLNTSDSGSVLAELEKALADGGVTYGTPGSLFARSLQSVKLEVSSQDGESTRASAQHVAYFVLSAYWESLQRLYGARFDLPSPFDFHVPVSQHDDMIAMLARGLGRLAAQHPPQLAGYWIGEVYTQLLPVSYRAQYGVYYTPPALTDRLLHLAERAGIDWRTARVLDPACGGGAFLAPVAIRIRQALAGLPAVEILHHIADQLRGFEFDSFGAWMSQVLLEASVYDLSVAASLRLPQLVEVRDTLYDGDGVGAFDLVIGNPPYGRVNLTAEQRERFKRSVYGHANLYGLFMDAAIRLARVGGIIAFVTPTSFLGGNYFRNLRTLMAREAPPVAIDLVSSRKGVFTDVLQETLLAVYQRGGRPRQAPVSIAELMSETELNSEPAGVFALPHLKHEPWLLPRNTEQMRLVEYAPMLRCRLRDYGYRVSTGPLVWNRHKSQLTDDYVVGSYPIVWAESITRDGRFVYRTDKRNHKRFIRLREGDDWLVIREPCVILQRTTAMEQQRRLIATELPAEFVAQHGAVSVENHLNMVRPAVDHPAVSPQALAALLNSDVVDSVFRCINGSVAVSATELEALPLPDLASTLHLEQMLRDGRPTEQIQSYLTALYMGEDIHAFA